MRVNYINMVNFRRFQRARFFLNPKFTVLIGDNGAGKTTVLDAVAIMLATYLQDSGVPTGRSGVSKGDAHLQILEANQEYFPLPADDVYLTTMMEIHGRTLKWRKDLGDRGGKAKNVIELGRESRRRVKEGVDLPLLQYYGAGRVWESLRQTEEDNLESQLAAYRYCLNSKSDLKTFGAWFRRITFAQAQDGRETPALRAIEEAVVGCVPGASAFQYNIRRGEIMLRLDGEGWIPFNSLSSGFRNMVAMVADLAYRATRLNPHRGVDAVRTTEGVVLIDELELHLHPKWQRHVVHDLKAAFPKLQFIATTHSPFIIQSLRPGEVIDLNRTDYPEWREGLAIDSAAPGPADQYSDRSIEDIVEDTMGVQVPQRSERHRQMWEAAQEYYRVLEAGKGANPATKDELKRRLDELAAPFSDDVAYHAFLEMERVAAGLGRSVRRKGGDATGG